MNDEEITGDILKALGFKFHYSKYCPKDTHYSINIIYDSEGLGTNCKLVYYTLYKSFELKVQQGGGEEPYETTKLSLPFIKTKYQLLQFVKLLIDIDL